MSLADSKALQYRSMGPVSHARWPFLAAVHNSFALKSSPAAEVCEGLRGSHPGGRERVGRQWPLLSGRFWCLGAQVLQQHKQQHVRAQPGELRFQLTNLFSWQEPTFPCIKKKKEKKRGECMRQNYFLPQHLFWSQGECTKLSLCVMSCLDESIFLLWWNQGASGFWPAT